ncbi:hypothetical protein [Streptomyces sp. NPDC001380]|uniref:hypothetical protein n=1 Tax=Streptomyces sp. NPDC001380 TaxID=3364566 RepID=UPI0036A25656
MVFSVSSFRQWLQEKPELVLMLFRHVEKTHGPSALQYHGGPATSKLRKTPGARMWVTRAPEKLLVSLCACGARLAGSRLCELGYEEQIPNPDLTQLTQMLRDLPPDLAQLMLYGLLLFGDLPAHRLACDHAEELHEVAASHAAPLTEADYERLSCAGQAVRDAADASRSSADGERTAPPGARGSEIVLKPDADGIGQETVRLKEAAEALASRLDVFVAAVRAGRLAGDRKLLRQAVLWVQERRALSRALADADAGGAWGDDQEWEAAEALVDRIRDDERRRQEIDREILETAQALDEARTVFEATSSEMLRGHLRDQITEYEQRIRELRGQAPDEGDAPRFGTEAGIGQPGEETSESDPDPAPVNAGGDSEEVSGAAESEMIVPVDDVMSTIEMETSTVEALTSPTAEPEREQKQSRTPEVLAPKEPDDPRESEEPRPATLRAAGEQPAASSSETPAAKNAVVPDPLPVPAPRRSTHAVKSATDVWSGASAPVVNLVTQGRLAESYWLTRAAGAPVHRALALGFADAAFHASPVWASDLQVEAEELFGTADEDRPWDHDRDAHLVLLTAAIRSGLSARWASSVLTDYTSLSGLSGPWARVLDELVHAVRQSAEIRPGNLDAPAAASAVDRREEIGERARQLALDLPQRTIKYQRGTIVLQVLAAPDGTLGHTLETIQGWTEGRVESEELAKEMEEHYKRSDAADRMIDAADRAKRTPKQAKFPIHSAARDQLRGHIKGVQDLLTAALRIASSPRSSGGRDVGRDLMKAITAAHQTKPLPGVGGALLALLLRWLDGSYTPELRDTRFRPPADGLLHLPGLSWRVDEGRDEPELDDQDTPGREHQDALMAMLGLVDPVVPDVALRRHWDEGDLHLAARLLERLEQGRVLGAAIRAAQLSEWRQTHSDKAVYWRRKCTEEHQRAQLALAQMRVQNLLKAKDEHDFTVRLLDLEGDHGDRHGQRFRAIARIGDDLRSIEKRHTEQLYRELDAARLTMAEDRRIRGLLDRREMVAAEELLSFARGGKALPAATEPAGEELARFLAGVAHPNAPQPTRHGVSARWWAHHYAGDDSLVQNAVAGLDSWENLIRERDPRKVRGSAMSVLRLLGLHVTEANVEEGRHGVTRLSVRADITESTPGYVAALGSQARRMYKVVVIADELRGEGPLRHLPDSAIGANVILYLQPLGIEGRRQLALASRSRGQQALVIDPAVVGWVAARAPRSFRAVQRVTLPWTGYTPYTPHVAGLVPPEVFKGRAEEMREVLRPDGSIFLFGGRQLGKSSLLRQAVEVFQKADPDRHIAVYVDLLKADIGHAEPPDGIWRVLLAELKRRGVISGSISDHGPVDTIADKIRQWIEAESGRRILLLADEADAFLTADAQAVYTGGGQSTFRTVKRLQRLMEDTNRTFKVVFAGLHQVQRFNHLVNVVTAHGGPGVLVGPLKPQAAVALVEEPLAAVGLTFERPDLVWHILGITNYQANLVQIFCDHLVAYMQQRAMPAGGRHAPITWDDVQAVANLERVRELIAERLRYTINLEDRYRVLALLIALRSLEHGYAHATRPGELLEEAHRIWREGFPLNSERQLTIYLDEMVGLGLLIKLPTQERAYAMRSPNVVNMLGTRNELESELNDTQFDLPYDYNPRSARRSVGVLGGVQVMSPLTEGQFGDMLGHSTRTTIVPCTRALGDHLVERGLRLYSDGYGLDVVTVGPDDSLVDAITSNSRRRRGSRLLFVDLRGRTGAQVKEAAQRLVEHTGATAIDAEATPDASRRYAVVLCSPVTAAEAETTNAGLVIPQRWTVDSVRAWPESPFGSPQERRSLIDATGGWPGLVELAMHNVRSGMRHREVLQGLCEQFDTPAAATAHLQAAGLVDADISRLAAWAQFYSVEEYLAGKAVMTPGDLAAALFDESDDDHALEAAERLLERLERLAVLDPAETGVRLDAVSFRALKTIGPAQ